MSFKKIFLPKKNYKLIRLGKDNDGGYLVGSKNLLLSKNLISLGISDDWSFELQCLKLNPKLKIFSFDNQLSYKFLFKNIVLSFIRIFYFQSNVLIFLNKLKNFFVFIFIKKKINLKKKFIGKKELKKIIKFKKEIFFKIDIEGNEYRILNELIKIKNNINAIIIEFHDVDLHMDKIENFIKKIGLILTHIHPNNFSKLNENKDPTCIEMTFEKFIIIKDNQKVVLPKKLDMKSDPFKQDYKLKFK